MKHSLFISFEGGEGAGKSTLIDSLARQIAARGQHVIKTREPGGTYLGEHVRTILLEQRALCSRAELFLFLAARAQHLEEVIRPALENKKVVLCDRFNDSTIAYQGVGRGLGAEVVAKLCQFACEDLEPDLTFYLDIDPKMGLMRAQRDHPTDRIESEGIEFHKRIREAFLSMKKKRIHYLDASLSAEAVCAEAMNIISKLLS